MGGLPTWTHIGPFVVTYRDGTKLQLEDVLSQVIDILSHSLGPLPSVLSAADWLFRNKNEGTPVIAITILSEAFGIEGFTIRISRSWILKQWREFNLGIPRRWMGDTRCWKQVSGENPTCHYWVTSKNSSECQRLIANMEKQKDRYSTLPMLANMDTRLWRFVQMTQIFL